MAEAPKMGFASQYVFATFWAFLAVLVRAFWWFYFRQTRAFVLGAEFLVLYDFGNISVPLPVPVCRLSALHGPPRFCSVQWPPPELGVIWLLIHNGASLPLFTLLSAFGLLWISLLLFGFLRAKITLEWKLKPALLKELMLSSLPLGGSSIL